MLMILKVKYYNNVTSKEKYIFKVGGLATWINNFHLNLETANI
jgi:hypothetical protein